jgi:hypothetical protein
MIGIDHGIGLVDTIWWEQDHGKRSLLQVW